MSYLDVITPVQALRFWTKHRKNPETGCWDWTASRSAKGYGHYGVGHQPSGTIRSAIASRLAWELTNGAVPPGLMVLHSCDNPGCVNPEHLRTGTCRDNARDCVARGRKWAPVGVDSPVAKLDPDAVRSIRKRYAEGVSLAQMARDEGVSPSCVKDVLTGRTWRHIPVIDLG